MRTSHIGAGRRREGRAKLVAAAILVAALALTLAACGGTSSADRTATAAARPPVPTRPPGAPIPSDVGKDDRAQLTGAGATFPNPLYTRWFSDYKSNIAPGVEVNYQAVGSGGGIRQISERTVDFGASDAPMTDMELDKAGAIQHIPTTLGAVVVTYNVAGVSSPLRFDGDTIAKIYLGDIKKWDDPAIAGQNEGVALPDADIVVVHRSDGSGTSYVFTDYLGHVSPDWKDRVGTSKNPQWPRGLGGQGNDGVTQQVKQNENSIGYVELVYAKTNNLPVAQVKNRSGEYVTPSPESTSLAASGVKLPDDFRISVVELPGARRIPDIELHLRAALQEAEELREGQGARRPALVGRARWPEDHRRTWLRAAPRRRRRGRRKITDLRHHLRRPATARGGRTDRRPRARR